MADSGCRKCGEEGHFARDCPEGGGGGGDGKCRNCRQEDEEGSSPKKTLLASLAITAGEEKVGQCLFPGWFYDRSFAMAQRKSILKEDTRSRASRRPRAPTRIEEVPFRCRLLYIFNLTPPLTLFDKLCLPAGGRTGGR